MKNKILIKLIVPSLMEEFDIFIPVNERISKIKELLINSIFELSDNALDTRLIYSLINPETGEIYNNNLIIRNTNIRNNTRLVMYQMK